MTLTEMRAVITTKGLTHRYGRLTALDNVDLAIPEGSVYALLGPNGSGKSTLLQTLMGLRHPTAGEIDVLGKSVRALTVSDRAQIGYMADGLRLPDWMTLRQLEAYVAPLYDTWDNALADDLRDRFGLDAGRKIKTLSRGERMKAALLVSLVPRPRLILLDEPFNGIDVITKDELVRGLLESSGSEGWTVVIASHDLAELESLADWVGFLDRGKLTLSESMETLRERFKRVEVVTPPAEKQPFSEDWLSVERSGQRISFVTRGASEAELRSSLPAPAEVEVRTATLREIFIALTDRKVSKRAKELTK
jgi:ABC-2 type transport system ATP-binding protein